MTEDSTVWEDPRGGTDSGRGFSRAQLTWEGRECTPAKDRSRARGQEGSPQTGCTSLGAQGEEQGSMTGLCGYAKGPTPSAVQAGQGAEVVTSGGLLPIKFNGWLAVSETCEAFF